MSDTSQATSESLPEQKTETSLANTNLDQTTKTTTEDTKTSDDKSLVNDKVEDKPVDKKDTKPSGAPEKYEAFKVSEGYELTEEGSTKVNTLFKELNLTQEQGQKLVSMYAEEIQKVAQDPVDYWRTMQSDWKKEITNDKAYGDGAGKLRPETMKAISDIKNIMGPELRDQFEEAMDLTGAGNNPAFIKGMVAISKLLSEGSHVAGNGPSKFGQQKPGAPSGPGAAAMYPSLPSAQGG